MAGIEQIVVHSKSYIVRWVQVSEHETISWSLQPQKKSINFGIFKHPGTKNGLTPVLPSSDTFEPIATTPAVDGPAEKTTQRRASVATSNVIEKLENIGLKSVAWSGRCEADKVTIGRYDVPAGESGMYGLVFDNTFSKQTSKTVNFVLITHPSNAAPKSGHHLHYAGAFGANTTINRKASSPMLRPISDSNESLPQPVLEDPRPNSKGKGVETKGVEGTSFYTGVLHKKRRKKGQGYAKRFFSLDFTSSTLSYYHDRHTSALRGAVPLSLAVVGANERTREFSIDSGAEVWHLKALNKKDFQGWREALERAAAISSSLPPTPARGLQEASSAFPSDPADDQNWARVEQLVSKVSGTRDAVRALAKDTDPKYMPGPNGASLGITWSRDSSNAPSPVSYEPPKGYFHEVDEKTQDKRPFWKRRPSERNASAERRPAGLFRRSVSAQLAVPSPTNNSTPISPALPPSTDSLHIPKRPSMNTLPTVPDSDVHERCMALLRDLDTVVSDFATLIAETKARRVPPLTATSTRLSLDSINDQEFFDAEDGISNPKQLLDIGKSSEFEDAPEEPLFDQDSEAESDFSSDDEEATTTKRTSFDGASQPTQHSLFPPLPTSLPPLPHPPVTRRLTVPPPKHSPPSIIGFLRKNAGKDLSTVSMPVTANEPTSGLQRLAESMEYSHLLDSAASTTISPAERLMYVSAFAVSYFANSRVKERAIRKPFNPMLGETYELVREDLGFRFVSEKVSHHPVRMACQAQSLAHDGKGWTFAQSPQPVQKFWGKSVELNTEGRCRVVLHGVGEVYSWSQATCFLRNVIAGEKYVEPVGSMSVGCEGSGLRAVVGFRAGGMFSGRSEEVSVQILDSGESGQQAALEVGLSGKWTEGLKRTDTGEVIWKAGTLVPDAPKVYGFTTFAAELNEVTEIERGCLPPTDSRLRPDQQALEASEVDGAEALKARLEERQRARRKVLETHGQNWRPQFFEKVVDGRGDGEELWRLREGSANGYWERREKGDWSGIQEVFEL